MVRRQTQMAGQEKKGKTKGITVSDRRNITLTHHCVFKRSISTYRQCFLLSVFFFFLPFCSFNFLCFLFFLFSHTCCFFFYFQSAISRLVLRPQWNTGVIRKSAPHSFLVENSVQFKNLFCFSFWQSSSLVFLHNMDSFMWGLILEFHSLFLSSASLRRTPKTWQCVWFNCESGSKSLQKERKKGAMQAFE